MLNAAEVDRKDDLLVDSVSRLPGSVVRITPPRSAHPSHLGNLVAASTAMCTIVEALERIAVTDVTLTLVGETGTGKGPSILLRNVTPSNAEPLL